MRFTSVYEDANYIGQDQLKKYRKQLTKINSYQDFYASCSLDELRRYARGFELRYRKSQTIHVEKLFACVREVCHRLLGKFQYDVQILGALATLDRNMIQMSTGSGKTITLILPAVYYGIHHKGCNVLTVNDYLSHRDWEEVHPVYEFFGLTSAYVSHEMADHVQREGFECDITYSTNSTLGFAWLSSSLASDIGVDKKIIHRPLFSAIIDEVDEILMDDARNPLIMAEGAENHLSTITHRGKVLSVFDIMEKLSKLTYLEVDEKDGGKPFIGSDTWEEIEQLLQLKGSIYENAELMHVIYNGITALYLLKPFEDYIVAKEPDPDSNSRIILIDKATGRLSRGRTLNDNLHAFVEMKEGVYTGISSHSTLQITYQILFNLFTHITGVTGTLGTSFQEFEEIYQCGVVVIPDRVPNQLLQETRLYPTYSHLYDGLVHEINWLLSAGFPILIGTPTDASAKMVSDILRQSNIQHTTLISIDTNEEEVVLQAGTFSSVVVTTDIMGRGTDIHLTDETKNQGLAVFQIGARPNSRVERQFAGRAGRQGLPGRYYRMISLTDMDDMGWMPSDLDKLITLWKSTPETVIKRYRGDVLAYGSSPDYDKTVDLINQALNAKESSYSSDRIQEFKTYAMIDRIQTAYIKQMDTCRHAIKESLDGYHYLLLEECAKWSLPENKRQNKKLIQKQMKRLVGCPVSILQESMFQFTLKIMREFIPLFREVSEEFKTTVSLAGMSGIQTPPEIQMSELLQEWIHKHEKPFLFRLLR